MGLDNGLPDDYCLRGTKRNQAHQICSFFEKISGFIGLMRNFADEPDYIEAKNKRDKVRALLANEL